MTERLPETTAGAQDSTIAAVALPRQSRSPLFLVARRMLLAFTVLMSAVMVTYLDRDGYRDSNGDGLTFLDALYYATVTLSTTGYGDITPFTQEARLVNVLVITPMRVMFLIILVGTTLEALTERSRTLWRVDRWRKRLKNHTVVIGFGTKGRSAVKTLLNNGTPRESIVVVDPSADTVGEANRVGLAGIVGDATRSDVLKRAEVDRATRVIVASQRDDTAVLVTLTARALNPKATIVSAVREAENAPLLQQSGADTVITSSDAAGRLLGLASASPAVGVVMEDLLVQGTGLELDERVPTTREVGGWLRDADDVVLAVVRNGKVRIFSDPGVRQLRANDRLIVVRGRPPGPEDTHEEGEER